MTVNCHVFQLVPYSDLQVYSANHFCIRKYLLVIVLIIIIFLIILKLIHSGYHAVGSIVEQHHLAAAVKLQKMNCSAIHKTCASLCLCTKVHFLEKKKRKSFDRWDCSRVSRGEQQDAMQASAHLLRSTSQLMRTNQFDQIWYAANLRLTGSSGACLLTRLFLCIT